MNTRKLISIILTIIIMVSATMSFNIVKAESEVKIELFGEIVTLPEGYGNPFIDATTSRTLVPARGLFEAIGATVNWAPETRTVTVSKEGLEIKVTIDSTLAYKNTTAIVLDQPPVIVGDRTYVPLRFVAESLDLNVDFDGTTTTVIIKEQKEKIASTEGIYKVGEDIDSTEYLFVANKDASKGNVKVKLLRGEDPEKTENVITTIDFKDSVYISLIGCTYVELIGCSAHSLDALPQRVTNGSCENGMFKVGKDLEPGTYAVSRVDSKETASYKIYYSPFSTSGTNKTESEAKISTNKNIPLRKGQYILLDNARLTKLEVVSGGSSGGGGGSTGSSSRPIVIPSATAAPTAVPTAQPTAAPQATHVPGTPTNEPTAEPTATPIPTAAPTVNPNISTEEYYPELDASIYDFGYHFNVPLERKDWIDQGAEMPDYMYDITSTDLIADGAVDIGLLRDVYGSKFISEGYHEKKVPDITTNEFTLGEYELYNPETGIWISCYFAKEPFPWTTYYYVNVTFWYNPIVEEDEEEFVPPEIPPEDMVDPDA